MAELHYWHPSRGYYNVLKDATLSSVRFERLSDNPRSEAVNVPDTSQDECMQSDLKEDFLEAILNIQIKKGHSASVSEIAAVLGQDPAVITKVLSELEKEGSVQRREDGALEFTHRGKEIAERVCRKHRVLECFLSEMLGIDGKSASKQACELEHKVSDETIDRISSYIGPRRRRYGWRRKTVAGGSEKISTLLDFEEGEELLVTAVRGAKKLDRLSALGILPGERILLRRKLPNDAIVVQVKDCDIALSPEVAGSILVEKTQ